MTPRKCSKHEYRSGEFADGPRYTQALRDSLTCWRCRLWGVIARIAYRFAEGTR